MANLPLPSFRKGGILEIFFRVILIQTEEGGVHMKCYVCAKQGVDEEAVAICIICGMGLCLGHVFKEELLVRDVIDWGFGEEKITYPRTLPRFICAECKLAMEQRKKGSQK